MSACSSFVKGALTETSCCITTVIEVHFEAVAFCLSDGLASMCTSIKAMPTSTMMANFLITVNNTLVSKSPAPMCSVMLLWVLYWSFDAYKTTVALP